MSYEAYNQGRYQQSTQDRNHEFITLIICVSVLGIMILLTLLYKGQSRDLQDTWVEDLEEQDNVFFGVTQNGQTNDIYGLKWLQEVFEPRTQLIRQTTKCLLIIDSYSSYINLQFIEWAVNYSILILILPPYSTHLISSFSHKNNQLHNTRSINTYRQA